MSVATCNVQGRPHVRTLLLRGATETGYDFYTNYDSQKGQDLAENPYVELMFYWHDLERQIRIGGRVNKIPELEAIDYYHKRPRDSQIAAHISTPQSGVIESREVLHSVLISSMIRWVTKLNCLNLSFGRLSPTA
jgi:pyridoxamine 5'-phosphate oxidase